MPSPVRPQVERTSTWPPTVPIATEAPAAHDAEHKPSAPSTRPKSDTEDEDLNEHPENHFLSPMYEYECWSDSDDDDGDDVEWNAGITDFALFDDDRRRAEQTGERLDSKWTSLISSQQSVLQRSVQRGQAASRPNTTIARTPLPLGAVPGLSPDDSPELRDDLDAETYDNQRAPSYLTITVTPPSPKDRKIEDDDDLPLTLNLGRSSSRQSQATRRVTRPGLRHSRTLSGKAHVWRRPSWHIYPVGEDPVAEAEAEAKAKDGEEK